MRREHVNVIARVKPYTGEEADVSSYGPGLSLSSSSVSWIHHAEEKRFALDRVYNHDDARAFEAHVTDAMVQAARSSINTSVVAFGSVHLSRYIYLSI
jgi:hypothetical protein